MEEAQQLFTIIAVQRFELIFVEWGRLWPELLKTKVAWYSEHSELQIFSASMWMT